MYSKRVIFMSNLNITLRSALKKSIVIMKITFTFTEFIRNWKYFFHIIS